MLAIHADASRHKKKISKKNAHTILGLVDDIHPAIILWLGRWLASSGRMDKLPLTGNSVVTNVPGISSTAFVDGIKLIDYLGFGPLAPNMGLFHTVSSTEDHVNVSFLSTADFLDDGVEYRLSLVNSWDAISRL